MPNGKHGHGGQPTTSFWKRLLILAIKVAVVIVAATVALQHTWLVVLAGAVGLTGYVVYRLVADTPITEHGIAEITTLLTAVGIVVGLQALGFRLGAMIIIGLIAYAALRILGAWIGRVRYWYGRGTGGHKTWKCPNCRGRRHRVGGDFIPHCYQCGWRPGFPILRWFQYSVFAQQAWRTLRRARIRLFLISVITITILVVLTVGTGFGLPLVSQDASPITGDTQLPNLGAGEGDTPVQSSGHRTTDSPAGTSATTSKFGYNLSKVETHFIELWNREREERGLQPVSQREILAEMGKSHSAVIAREGEIGHVEPDGSTIEDRYRDRNLLPECRLEIPASEEYYPGAENVAQTWIDRSVTVNASTKYIGSEEDLAEVLFEIWINSPPHRRPMLLPATDEAGLGLNITGNGAVYASLEMC